MVVNRDGQFLLCLVLADHVAIEKGFDFRRSRQAAADWAGLLFLFFLQNLLTNGDALVANVRARIFGRRADEFFDLLLRFMAEGAVQRFLWAESFHRSLRLRS